MMVWMASAGAVACMVSVIMALLAGMRYSAHLRRMPAATAFENVVERLKNGREELERVEAESEKQRGQRDAFKAELGVIIARRDATKAELDDLKNELIGLDGRKAEVLKVRGELTELRTQQAELLRDIAEHRAEYNELVIAAERARVQIALFDERKAEIEALAATEHEARTRLTEARGELDYINRQLAVARVEIERFTADREKSLAETQRIEEKKIQLQNELVQLQQARDPLVEKLEKTRQELETAYQELKVNRQKGQELEEELAYWRTVRGVTEVATETAHAELMKLQTELEPARQAQALATVQLQSVQHELAETNDQLQTQKATIADLRTKQSVTEEAIATASANLKTVEADLEKMQQERDPLATELEKNRQEIESIHQEVKKNRLQLQDVEDGLANLRFVRASIEATTATTKAQLESVRIELEKLQQQREPLVAELAAFETASKARQAIEDELAGLQTQRITAEVTLNTVRMDLENIQNQLEKSQQDRDLFKDERERAYQELESARRELTTVRGQSQEHQEELANLRALRANTEAAITTNREAVEAVQAELEELQEEHDPLSVELENVRREIITGRERRQELEEELAGLYAARAMTDAAVATNREAVEAVQIELAELQPSKKELEALRRKIAEARERQQELDDDYDLKLNRLEAIEAKIQAQVRGDPELDNTLDDLVRLPACLIDQKIAQRKASESDALQRVSQHLHALNLHFPQRTLYAFHTAIKTATISPLTVLAGISGTGKSQLPRRYAEAMGIHFLKIPVQPGWDSPQDMLGFYNYLEKRYKATELARALVHFDSHNWPEQAAPFKDQLMLVLLDEMNLARVEYYFSEFLSQLEGRPGPDQIDRDGILKSQIALDTGGAGGKSRSIYPGHNMLFVGTMNEDESTQTLSDKVLDRANLLRFPRPNKLVAEAFTSGIGTPIDAYLPASRWHGWRRRFSDLPDHLRTRITDTWIENLNSHLGDLHRPFAHRVNQAMLAYIANYPGVLEPERGDGLENARIAFADQLEQRILPKLRGVDLGDSALSQPLRQIGELIKNELHDEALYDAFQRASEDDGSGRPFIWMGVRREEAA